ncbi:COP9 signalosome complex subunit 8 [Nilaparvata lugens]|uniref:COP9 signalosome complex subunit 8 n=1 Tax=Nilaparvata lugens TaxID=108931 RepID=UPI00193E1456|nr:COP9 signalosome complex subunit 8 [Nilaparvata lugens]
MGIMVPDNFNNLADELEKQELDAPGGVPPPQVYAKLLAIYLYRNDLCNAKYLWKRIPLTSKSSYPELNLIWGVGKAMWQRDLPTVYSTIQNTPWSENVCNIMKALHEEVQKRATELVSRAYSSLSVDTLSALVGLRQEDALKLAAERGWQVDNGLVIPTRPVISTPPIASSEDQLYKLTDFVSFLEN